MSFTKGGLGCFLGAPLLLVHAVVVNAVGGALFVGGIFLLVTGQVGWGVGLILVSVLVLVLGRLFQD